MFWLKPIPTLVWLGLCACIVEPAVRHYSAGQNLVNRMPMGSARYVWDMVQNNPGEPSIVSTFNDPRKLASWGYNGQVEGNYVEGVATFDAVDPSLLPPESPERKWADAKTEAIRSEVQSAHNAGVKCYGWMQALVLPRAVVQKYKTEICDAQGRIDIDSPRTQQLFRAQLHEIFDRLPDLDGLVIRTGEIYLHDLPYHVASALDHDDPIQGNTSILHGPQSHIELLNILRDEVCVNRNKMVVYRTWDFGNNFHNNPAYYLRVTDSIDPHPNLLFSIKHQAGDFHQLTPFNPTLGIGKHRQIIEVQCQREAYGKGAHPYYIGQGVIDGWEEYSWMMKPGQPRGLHDILSNPLIAGVWTWSRGGGWGGPYVTSEFWCSLNAYVITKYAQDPHRSEPQILDEYARMIGLRGDDLKRFREINLLSEKAILRGQLTTLGVHVDPWWARDDTLAAPDLSEFVDSGLTSAALQEKHQAVEMWMRIESLARQINFPDPKLKDFVVTSCMYGRIKYAIIEQGWTILMYGKIGDNTGDYDRPRIARAIAAYDQLWQQWQQLRATDRWCSSLSVDRARGDKPGLGAAVDRYRQVLHEASFAEAAAR